MSIKQDKVSTPTSIGIGRQIDTSYAKLKWNVHGLFDKLEVIQSVLKKQLEETPTEKINERKKLKNWYDEIISISQKMENIKEKKIKDIESEFQCEFKTPELVVLTLIQPSACKIFRELKMYFNRKNIASISNEVFNDFIHMGDAMKVLALIGDAVINLALIQTLWDPDISKVGDLSVKRAKLVSNKNLGKICDNLKLYEYRIHKDPPAPEITEKKMNSIKGTIIEALFGVIYIENGLEAIISSIGILK